MDDPLDDPLNDPPGKPPGKPKPKWKRHYTKVPDAWKQRLLKAKRVSTYHLALELLYLHWKDGDEPIVVADKVAKAAGLSQRSKLNGLAELKRLGLIRLTRGVGRAPRAKLLRTESE